MIFFRNSIVWVWFYIEYCFYVGNKIELLVNWVFMKDGEIIKVVILDKVFVEY